MPANDRWDLIQRLKVKYQKGVYYLGVKVFNMLPPCVKAEFDNPKKFKVVIQKFLHENSFYSVDEYFE